MKVELYIQPECARCAAAREALRRLKAEQGFELIERDVASDALLRERFGARLPVALVDGREVAAGPSLDLTQLRQAVIGHGSRAAGLSRRGKLAFALFALASLAGVLGMKVWQVFIEPDQRALRYLGIEPLDAPAPEFAFEARGAKIVRLADYRGRYVLLHYWATWCDSCREELPSMALLAQVLGQEPISVIAATVDESWVPVDELLGGGKLPFEVLRDPESRWAKAYGTSKFPETYLIAPDGRLQAKLVGPRDWADRSFELYLR
ncbi:MAG: redoxin domain-containing protein, partial [Deltaproteobacteria bacterium]|nr:redoxin domain-containing protein [Deltaproteobacteria bacterium]